MSVVASRRVFTASLMAIIAAAAAAQAPAENEVQAPAEAEVGPDGRPKVIPRPSSEAQLAKGEINFDDLRMEIEKDAPFKEEMLTERILKKINGKKVKLRGYMLPASCYSDTRNPTFVLVRDNRECCFGPGAALFDSVYVEMVEGKFATYHTRPVTVEGKFEVDTEKYRYPPGMSKTGATHLCVFRINAVKVAP